MTLNDLERCNSPNFVFFFTEFDRFSADYVTMVEDRRIMSISQFQSSTFGKKNYNAPCSAVSAIAEHLVHSSA